MKVRIRIAYAAIGVTYIAVMATLLGACRPFPRHWQINPNPGSTLLPIQPYKTTQSNHYLKPDHCMPAVATVNSCVVLVLNALTDLYLLHIPIMVRSNSISHHLECL